MDPVVSVQNKNFAGNKKGACESSCSWIGYQKWFTLTIPWNSAKLVKISPGIIARLHHTDRRLMGLLREQCVKLRKEHLRYCCNQVWTWMVCGFHGMLLLSAKHSRSLVWWEDTLRKAVRSAPQRTSNAVWSNGWISPYLCEGHIETTSMWLSSLASFFLQLCIACGRNLERRHYDRRHWRIGGDGRVWTPRPKAQCKRKC